MSLEDRMKKIDLFLKSINNDSNATYGAFPTGGSRHHDHSTSHLEHSVIHEGHVMKMWFHGGLEEVILFDFWRVNSWSGMLLSCTLIFIMGAAYEGIKWFRVYLQIKQQPIRNNQKGSEVLPLQQPRNSSTDEIYNSTTIVTSTNAKEVTAKINLFNSTSPFATSRLIEATLYIFQLVLAYWLMLIVMTYNNYLTGAVILGAGFGHWLFAVLKFRNTLGETADSFVTDACH